MRNSNYQTVQKQLILDFLQKNHRSFLSANDILVYMLNQNEKIGLTTIYRHLNTLEEEGALRTEIHQKTKFYQYMDSGCKNHFHLKCEKCGRIEHFECEEMHDFCKHMGEEHGFQINPQNAIMGLCKKCQKKVRRVEK